MEIQHGQLRDQNPANIRIVTMCLCLVVGMGVLSYASVPLYDLFCRVTGFGGTTRQVESADGVSIIDRMINVRFDANTAAGLNWRFAPEKRQITVKMGERTAINYVVENHSEEAVVGMASFNVTPQSAGVFFNKIECFCFTDTSVKPGGRLEMPVVFYIDPDMDKEAVLKNLNTITLSYTFFEAKNTPEDVLAGQKDATKNGTASNS